MNLANWITDEDEWLIQVSVFHCLIRIPELLLSSFWNDKLIYQVIRFHVNVPHIHVSHISYG